jgi:hypothetical protein
LQDLEPQRNFRVAPFAKTPKAAVVDRIGLWLSTSRNVDGLWIGSTEGKPQPGLRRVENALQLMKDHDPLQYSRTINNLERVWVHLLPNALASYDRSLNACILDERVVLPETTTLERIASCIVHEATHARLERWGIGYDEKARSRIEAICLRRELNFVRKLPQSEPLQEELARTLEWCIGEHDYFSDANFRQRCEQGNIETLRYLGTPDLGNRHRAQNASGHYQDAPIRRSFRRGLFTSNLDAWSRRRFLPRSAQIRR